MTSVTSDKLMSTWAEMKGEATGYPVARQLFQTQSGVKVSRFCTQHGQVGLLINMKNEASFRLNPRYNNLKFQKVNKKDGTFDVIMILTASELEAYFALLCVQIIRGLSRLSGRVDSFLNSVLSEWSSLLKGTVQMSPEKERGLWCELHILEAAIRRHGKEAALNAWVGPDEAPQDFVFDSAAVEVKSVFEKAAEIKISSLDQLDFAGQLYLTVVALYKDPRGQTLKDKVESIEKLLDDGHSIEYFRDTLYQVGYVPTLEKTGSDDTYCADNVDWYDASHEEFPKLNRSAISPAIYSARYSLSVAALEKFKVGEFL